MGQEYENPTKGQRKHCTIYDCDQSFPNHRWGSIKAHGAGWYMQKDGTAYCPHHRPAWAPERTT